MYSGSRRVLNWCIGCEKWASKVQKLLIEHLEWYLSSLNLLWHMASYVVDAHKICLASRSIIHQYHWPRCCPCTKDGINDFTKQTTLLFPISLLLFLTFQCQLYTLSNYTVLYSFLQYFAITFLLLSSIVCSRKLKPFAFVATDIFSYIALFLLTSSSCSWMFCSLQMVINACVTSVLYPVTMMHVLHQLTRQTAWLINFLKCVCVANSTERAMRQK